jgi:SseB protein N-terminal domain
MSKNLDELMKLAGRDTRWEESAFRELLKCEVYAHVPATERFVDGRIRFIQFHRPENGELVLPFFSDKHKALAATGTTVKIVAFTGRELMELTRGATLMLNPNEMCCVLYPEEVDALLSDRPLGQTAYFTVEEGSPLTVSGLLEDPPAWMRGALIATLGALTYVSRAYMAEVHGGAKSPLGKHYLVVVGVTVGMGERAMHAVTTAMQPHCRAHNGPILDLGFFDDPGQMPDWIEDLSIAPFYDVRFESS